MENQEDTRPTEMDSAESSQGTQTSEVGTNCGAPLEEEQKIDPKCETARKKKVCSRCGAELTEEQEFCSKCGLKVGDTTDTGEISKINISYEEGVQKKSKKKKSKKKIVSIIVAVAVIIVILAVALVLRGPSVESITLTKSSIDLKVDESQKITYTISPEKASDAKVTWTSSNSSVADVDEDGKITANSEGACTITANAGKQSATVSVIVTDTINFMKQYGQYKDEDWCEIADDGSWLKLDSNPTNADSDDIWVYYEAYCGVTELVEVINADLGFNSSVYEKMKTTTALQGRQSESNDDYEVSWTYHPDNGLEIMYVVK